MIYLILSIVSSSFIYIIFKLLNKFKVELLPVIVVNYITAATIGYLFREKDFLVQEVLATDWVYPSIIIGILFVAMFYFIGIATQKAGITITSISTKMSVIFPILFSMFYYGESIYLLKVIGMLVALVAIVLSSIKGKAEDGGLKNFIFPIGLFLGMGLIDSFVKFNQEEFLKDTGALESTTVTFAVSALISLSIYLALYIKNKNKFELNSLLFGIFLGIVNFCSLFFLILALNTDFLDSSVIFAINNSAIIMISVLVGKYFFKEKLILLNWAGVFLSMIAIIALSF